jgi:hypothetical protein
MTLISGNTVFNENSCNNSARTEICGTGIFLSNSLNYGEINVAQFLGSSVNNGSVCESGTFYSTSRNNGPVNAAVFAENAVNTATVANAIFYGTAVNSGTVTQSATFANTSVNLGTVLGDAFIADTADNSRGTVSGSVLPYVPLYPHSYSFTGTINGKVVWSDDFILSTGSKLYLYNEGNISIGAYINDPVLDDSGHNFYYTDVNGVITNIVYIEHMYAYGDYWADSQNLALGDKVYSTKYDLATVQSAIFIQNGRTYTVTNGVVTHVAFNELGWYADYSDNHISIQNNSATQIDEGDGVVVAEFDGTTSYLETATNANLNVQNGNSTIEFWYKHGEYQYETILSAYNNNQLSVNGLHIHSFTDGKLHINNGQADDMEINMTLGTWQHVAIVISGNSKKAYLNGELVATSSQKFGNTSHFLIGKDATGNFYSGRLAGLRIVKGVALYSSNFAIPTDLPSAITNTQLLLNFGGAVAPTAHTWHDDFSLINTVTVNGEVNQSNRGGGVKVAAFDGSTGYFTVPNTPQFDLTDDFTIEFMVHAFDVNQYLPIFTYGTGQNGGSDYNGWNLHKEPNNGPLFFSRYDGGAEENYLFNWTMNSGVWYHVAVVRQSGVLKAYVNGVHLGNGFSTSTQFTRLNSTDNLQIGKAVYGGATHYLYAYLSGVRIVKGTAVYTNDFTVPANLPSRIVGTKLLLTFGSSRVPTYSHWYNDTSSPDNNLYLNNYVTKTDFGSGLFAATFENHLYSPDNSLHYLINPEDYFGTNDFTVEMWVNQSEIDSPYNRVFGLIDSSANQSVVLNNGHASFSEQKYSFEVTGGLGGFSNEDMTFNVWNHFAVVRQSGVVYLYINGLKQDYATFLHADSWNFNEFFIGDSNSSYAGVRVVNGTAVYTEDFSVPTTLPEDISGTVLLLNFDATSAPTYTNPTDGTLLFSTGVYVTIDGFQRSVGTVDVIADGNGGTRRENTQYATSGTEIYDDGSTYHYLSNGDGTYTQQYRYGYVVASGVQNTITITESNNYSANNGTYDLIYDGNGNEIAANYMYPSSGTELYSDGVAYRYLADGNGGYTQVFLWFADRSGNNHAVTLNGSITQGDDGNGILSAVFDGASDISVNGPFNFETGDFTVEFFVNNHAFTYGDGVPADAQHGFNVYIDANSAFNFLIGYISDTAAFTQSGKDIFPNTPSGFGVDTWHHVALTRSSSTITLFADGISIGTVSDARTLNLSSISIGSVGGQHAIHFIGKMAGFRVVNGTALYTSNFTPPLTLPTAISGTDLLLTFDATNSPFAGPWYSDLSDNHHAVTLNGSVTQSDEGGGVVAASFDGNSSNLEYSSVSDFDFGSGDYTVELFVKPSAQSSSYATLVTTSTPNDGSGFWVGDHDGVLTSLEGNGNWQTNFTSNTLTQDVWSHIAYVRSSSTVYLFINGVSAGSYTSSVALVNTGVIDVGGRTVSSQYFVGKIAGLRVTNTALYTSNFSVPTTLPTAVAGTQLLLNFGATAVPSTIPPNGTVFQSGLAYNIDINGTQFQDGTYSIVADGNGGCCNSCYVYCDSGYEFCRDNSYTYNSDGSGNYTTTYRGYGEFLYAEAYNVFVSEVNAPFQDGCVSYFANGYGGTYANYEYCPYQCVVTYSGYDYFRSDGGGGYYYSNENPNPPYGTYICGNGISTYFPDGYIRNVGYVDYYADGSGGCYSNVYYDPNWCVYYQYGYVCVMADGNGYYRFASPGPGTTYITFCYVVNPINYFGSLPNCDIVLSYNYDYIYDYCGNYYTCTCNVYGDGYSCAQCLVHESNVWYGVYTYGLGYFSSLYQTSTYCPPAGTIMCSDTLYTNVYSNEFGWMYNIPDGSYCIVADGYGGCYCQTNWAPFATCLTTDYWNYWIFYSDGYGGAYCVPAQ